MPSKSGGPATAYGMGYQHLVVVEELLDLLESGETSWSLFLESADDDAVDYGVRGGRGLARVVQAKSSVDGPMGRSITVTDAVRVFERMIRGARSESYILRTNKPIASTLAWLDAELTLLRQWHSGSPHAAAAVRAALLKLNVTLGPDCDNDSMLERFSRCRIVADDWHLPDVAEHLAKRVRALRRARGWGTGQESAEILVYNLAMRFVAISATAPGVELSTKQLERMLFPADQVVAQAHGSYDWGTVVGQIPNVDAVPRPEASTFLQSALAGPPPRQPRKVVLTGFSGSGKSTIAAGFVRDNPASYDHIVWIDAQDASTIRQAVRRLFDQPGGDDDGSASGAGGLGLEASFRALFQESPDAWLLIFDNAPSAVNIRDWCPTQGHVDIVATSNDAVAWAGWNALKVAHLPRDISVALIQKRTKMQAPTAAWYEKASVLAHQLDDWPLTLELACAYLNASGRGLEFAPQYVDLLMSKIIDEHVLVPETYRSHRTLFRAVMVALSGLESRASSTDCGATGRYHLASAALDALAYLPGRSAHAGLAISVAMRLSNQTSDPGTDAPTDAVALSLAEFSLASRAVVGRSASVSSTFRTNEAVLHVVRERQSAHRRATVLAIVIETAHEYVKSAIDERARTDAELIAPSATSALEWLLSSGYASKYGVLLSGNLAVLWSALNRHEVSLEYFELELRLLDAMGQDAPRLRAKIYAAMASARATLEQSTEEILDAVAASTRTLEEWAFDVDPDDREKVIHQLESVLALLARNPREGLANVSMINAAARDIQKQSPSARNAAYDIAQRARTLLDVQGQDAAALALIDSVIADPNCPDTILRDVLGLRVEALVYLRRMGDAANAVHDAYQAANAAFGIEEVSDVLINAWLAALRTRFMGDSSPTRKLIKLLETVFAEVGLSQPNSQARLDACRLASAAHEGNLDEIVDVLARLNEAAFDPVRGVRSERPTLALVDASRRLVALRRKHTNAVVIPCEGWARMTTPFGVSAIALVIADEWVHLFAGRPSALSGEWMVEQDAVLFGVDDVPAVLVALSRLRTGWLHLDEGASEEIQEPATMRLEQILRSTDFADTVRLVAVIASSEDVPLVVVAARPPSF